MGSQLYTVIFTVVVDANTTAAEISIVPATAPDFPQKCLVQPPRFQLEVRPKGLKTHSDLLWQRDLQVTTRHRHKCQYRLH